MSPKRLSDSAALAALDPGLGAGGGGAPMDMPMPDDMAAMGGGSPTEGGIEAGISMIEADLASAPPDLAEEARVHINALRDIAGKIGGEAPTEMPPQEEPPVPSGGEEV